MGVCVFLFTVKEFIREQRCQGQALCRHGTLVSLKMSGLWKYSTSQRFGYTFSRECTVHQSQTLFLRSEEVQTAALCHWSKGTYSEILSPRFKHCCKIMTKLTKCIPLFYTRKLLKMKLPIHLQQPY